LKLYILCSILVFVLLRILRMDSFAPLEVLETFVLLIFSGVYVIEKSYTDFYGGFLSYKKLQETENILIYKSTLE